MEIEKRRADDIKADVSSHLFWDNSLDSSDINVDVADNRVILTGTVPSYSDLLEAEEDAYSIPGVVAVDNRLGVNPAVSPVPSDTDIRTRVENVLDWNPVIDASRIDIAVDDGVITLRGAVDSFWQKDKAWDLASNVSGVVDVINEIRVDPLEEITDEDVMDDILNALDRSYVDVGDVDITVDDCVVTLEGTVHDYYEYRTVEQIAHFTTGVCDVRNNLIIASV